MRRFLNKGNEKFARFTKTKYFVDKTAFLNKLLELDDSEKFVCNSRPRRFGKSVTADMLVAYFSKGADSKSLFEPLACVRDALFLESLNQYDTIFVDIQAQYTEAYKKRAAPNEYIEQNFDEWDYPIRELGKDRREREEYKEHTCVRAVSKRC